MASEAEQTCWQALPAFLAQQLVGRVLREELRWGPHIAPLRLVSRGWRDAISDALPILAPRPHIPAAEVVAVAAQFQGLHILRLHRPSPTAMGADAAQQEQAAALAALCRGACPSLRSLHMINWNGLTDDAMSPLASLQLLRRLEIHSSHLKAGAVLAEAVRQLQHLRSLTLHCDAILPPCAEALTSLARLTRLELKIVPASGPSREWAALGQLTKLKELHLTGMHQLGAAELAALSAMSQLSSLAIERGSCLDTPALAALLALCPGGTGGGTRGSSSTGGGTGLSRLQYTVQMLGMGADPTLELAPLQGLEALRVSYSRLQVLPPTELRCLSGLTELYLDLEPLQAEEDLEVEIGALVTVIGRRLTGLRQLTLRGSSHVPEPALVELSGLTQLSSLELLRAFDFGGRALAALLPLRQLRRLSLSEITLNPTSVTVALGGEGLGGESRVESEGAEGSAEGEGAEAGEAELPLPGLTYLALSDCRLMSGASVAQLVTRLPSLRHFLHRGWPYLAQHHLHTMLESCPELRLLQTTWRPAAAPLAAAARENLAAARVNHRAAIQELQTAYANALVESQVQVLQRADITQLIDTAAQMLQGEEEPDFCEQWRFKLQHSLPTTLSDFRDEGYYTFDAAQALRSEAEAVQAL